MEMEEAKRWVKTGDIRKIGMKYAKPIKIEYDRLGRPWLKVKTWLIHPEKATKYNLCNAEGIGYIPLF